MNALTDISVLAAGSDWHHHGVWWLPFGLLWLTVFTVLIWFAVRHHRRGERASDIVAERFARGEISGEEYRALLDELKRGR
jgi:putative membrane protein